MTQLIEYMVVPQFIKLTLVTPGESVQPAHPSSAVSLTESPEINQEEETIPRVYLAHFTFYLIL